MESYFKYYIIYPGLRNKMERADCDEAVWCKIVTGISTLSIGLVYRNANINDDAMKEVSKGYRKGRFLLRTHKMEISRE